MHGQLSKKKAAKAASISGGQIRTDVWQRLV